MGEMVEGKLKHSAYRYTRSSCTKILCFTCLGQSSLPVNWAGLWFNSFADGVR